MAIVNKGTYGEWYWGHGLDASLEEHAQLEQEFAGLINNVISGFEVLGELPPPLASLFNSLITPAGKGLDGVGLRFLSETADGVVAPILNSALRDFNYWLNAKFADLRIDAPTAATLFQRGKVTEEMYQSRMSSAGYKPAEANAFYDSLRPYPTIPDIVLWSRYHGDPENIREKVWERFDVDTLDFDLWQWLGLQRLTTEQCQSLFKREILDEYKFDNELAQIGWSEKDRLHIKDLSYSLPNAMLLAQGGLMQGLSTEEIIKLISMSDIHPDYAQSYFDAIRTKPASQDIIAYQLRLDPNLSNLPAELRRIGIHPEYTELYKTLAHPIPPVADIITMAVREAFTPDVARRFGQYEDFPPDFERYAGMKGLSKEWAERYWAAHWNLPSPQQGFEMLHRGVIDRDTLDILLRALDVMPFWRDKLTEIAYRPLTRVDVRRMYRVGVLDEREVVEAYLIAGYSEDNAQRMAEFTVRQTLATLSKFTSGDIVKAYTQRMIERSEAMSLLNTIGIRREDAEYILSTAEYKRQWALTEQKIKGIKNLYKKKEYSEDDTRDALNKLDMPAEQVNLLMEQWWYEAKEDIPPTWTTAQTLSFTKKGLITPERAERELQLIGYDREHIDVYMRSIT